MENVVMALFDVESEGYQALAELRRTPAGDDFVISQAGLVKKEGGRIVPCEVFDSGVTTKDDTAMGGLIGGMLGILGGPLGVLFSGSMGALFGSVMDSEDAARSASMLEMVTRKLQDGQTALAVLIQEEDEAAFDSRLSRFKVEILRWDAADIEDEVERAVELEKEMRREARLKLRREKKEERQQEMEERRTRIHAEMEALKAKFRRA